MFIFQWLFLAGYCDGNWHWLLADACLCAITILIWSLWLSQTLPAPFQSFSGVGRKLPLLRVTSSICWLCGGCSLGWGFCTDRLDLDDLQMPTVAAKALGPTLHVENFSELIWKFEPVSVVRIILFDSVTWGWFPLWAALCSTLPQKLPPRNGSERFRTVLNYCGGVLRMVFGLVWTSFWEFFFVFYCFLEWLSRLQSTWEGPEEEGLYNEKKAAVKSQLEIEPFQGFMQQQSPPSLFQCQGVGQTWHWSCQAPRTLSNAPPLLTLL